MENIAISVCSLKKNYQNVEALRSIDLEVNRGEIFGLIGPDGAGKTTLIRILTTLVLPDEGLVQVLGYDVQKDYVAIRNRMGYMPGKFSLYEDLSIKENLELFASIYETTIPENYHLIKEIYQQIEPFKRRKAGKLSGGMKQKLALCCALIHEPEVLFLDEPTTGVDPVSRDEFWEMLRLLKERNITILVSTPYMDEANRCDRVALMQDGKIMDIHSPNQIINGFKDRIYAIKSANRFTLIRDLREYSHAKSVFPFGEYLHYVDKRNQASEEEILQYLSDKNQKKVEIKSIQPTIEDCFMELMVKKDE